MNTERVGLMASAEKFPVAPAPVFTASAMNNPRSAPVLFAVSWRSSHVPTVGSVVVSVPLDAVPGSVAASIVAVSELSPWAIKATRRLFAPAVNPASAGSPIVPRVVAPPVL
jgi:hypothetical protein